MKISRSVLDWIEVRADKYGQIVARWIRRGTVRARKRVVGRYYADLICATYHTPEDQMETLERALHELMELASKQESELKKILAIHEAKIKPCLTSHSKET